MSTRVLVTGSRNFTDYDLMVSSLEALQRLWPDAEITVVHGGAKGADNLAEAAAARLGYATESHPADWSKGRGAGPQRNAAMVALGADLCLAFPIGKSPGTRGCMELARRAGIKVVNVTEKRA
jgi:hypothetical protein